MLNHAPSLNQSAPHHVLAQQAASPMGEHFELTASIGGRSQRVVVTEIAASLRELDVDGVALVQDYPADAQPPWCAGWVLVPWPNRVAGGMWSYDGVAQQLDITEPENGNALHGLLTHTPYRVSARTPDSITLDARLSPQPGYPFELATSVRYQLVEDGLRVTHCLENTGSRSAPVALGAHPFLRLGSVPTEELTLHINADTHIEVDERLNPSGITTDVSGTGNDFRTGQLVGSVDSTMPGAMCVGKVMAAPCTIWRRPTAAKFSCSWTPPSATSKLSPPRTSPPTAAW